MANELNQEPTLAEAFSWAFDARIAQLFQALPARVVSYDNTEQTVEVQPLLQHNYRITDGTIAQLTPPQIPGVPVVFPRAGSRYLSFPIQPGDKVLLVYCDRNIDQYMQSDGSRPVDPKDIAMFSANGAVAIPGFFPTGQALDPADADTSDLMIGTEGSGIRIRIEDSAIKIEQSGQPEKSAVTYEDLENFWNATFKTAYDTHTHPTGVGPSGPPVTPAASLDTAMKSDKLKIAGN